MCRNMQRKDWFKECEMDTLTLQFSLLCLFTVLRRPLGKSCFADFERKTMTRLG